MSSMKTPFLEIPQEFLPNIFERPEQEITREDPESNSKGKKHILRVNPDLWFEELLDKTNSTTFEKEITCRNLNLLTTASRFIGKQKLKLKRARSVETRSRSQDLFDIPSGANELETPPVSWEVDEDHPLKSSLTPGPPSRSCLSNNWYQRLNWVWRDGYSNSTSTSGISDDPKYIEHDLSFIKEIGKFYAAARTAAVALIHCQPSFNYGVAKAYYEITKTSNENLWSIYCPLFADDRVFVFDSMVFTVILGSKKNGISREIAKRLYNNEFKSKKAFCDILIQIGQKALFALPICAIVKYLGYSVFCEPLVPFNPRPKDILRELLLSASIPRNIVSTLEGNDDHDDELYVVNCKSKKDVNTMFDSLLTYNSELAGQLDFIAKQLNIQGWPFPMETTDLYEHYGIKYTFKIWQHRSDGLYITRHCGELLPVYVDENQEVQPLRRLREEFIITYTNSPLPSTVSVPLFLNSNSGDPTNDYHTEKLEAQLGEHHLTGGTSSRLSVLFNASQAMRIRLLMDLIPTVNELYVGFHDSWEITELLHNYGINLNYGLGKLAQGKVIEPIRNTAIREILARTIKRLWEEEMHVSFMDQTLINEETIQIILIDFLNKIFCNTDESNKYWNSKIIPSAIKRFQLNSFNGIISKSNVQLSTLFYSMQFHIGVHFNTNVINSDGSLRLPLKIDDLCDYTEINIGVDYMFPQVKYLKYTLAHTQKLKRDSLVEALQGSNPQKMPILTLFSNQTNAYLMNQSRDERTIHSTNGKVLAWNETGIIRGYYPRVKIVVPRTLKSINICKTILCRYIWKLRIRTWNNIFITSSKHAANNKLGDNLFSSSSILCNPIYINIVTMGNISSLKASLEGFATPCHPICKPIYSKEKNSTNKIDVNISCQSHYDCYKALYYLVIAKRLIGENLERVLFLVLNIGYLALQHNNLDECLSICQESFLCTPEIPKFQVLILALKIQCLIKYNKFEEATKEFNYLKKLVLQLYGNHRNCLVLTKLQLSFSLLYFVNGNYQECFRNSSQVEKILTPLLSEVSDSESTHWMIIIALRFIALSSLQLGNYAQCIVVGEKMLRATIKSNTRQIYLESICRYIIGEATIRCGRYDNALKILINSIPELDGYIGPSHKFTIKFLMMSTRCKIILGCRDLMFPPLNLQDRETEVDYEYQEQMVYDLFCIEQELNILGGNETLNHNYDKVMSSHQKFANSCKYWTRFPVTIKYDDILIMEKSIFDKKTSKCREEALLMCRSLINRIMTNLRGTGSILGVDESSYSKEEQIWYNRILWVLKHEIVISMFSLSQLEQTRLLASIRSIAVSSSASPFVKDLTFGREIVYNGNVDETFAMKQNIENELNNDANLSQRIVNKRITDFTDVGYIDYCNINTNIHEHIISKNNIENGIGETSNYFGASVVMSPRQMGHISQEKENYWELLTSKPTMSIIEICGQVYKLLVQKKITSAYEWCKNIIRNVSAGKSDTYEINIVLNLMRISLSKFHKKYMIALLYPETISKAVDNINKSKTKYGLKVYQNYFYEENDTFDGNNRMINDCFHIENSGGAGSSINHRGGSIYRNNFNKKYDSCGNITSGNNQGIYCNISKNQVKSVGNGSSISSMGLDLDGSLGYSNGYKYISENNNDSKIDYTVLPQYNTEVAANLMLPMNQRRRVIDINRDIRWKDPHRNYKYYDSISQKNAQLYIPKEIYER
ncbi:translation initiation factor eIF3 subunit 135 [Cryptosporidium felis]|nr:translation initiation factor eIF3 subunit 135 [Cryptosporidium felis]